MLEIRRSTWQVLAAPILMLYLAEEAGLAGWLGVKGGQTCH